jgi:hypothetical protein
MAESQDWLRTAMRRIAYDFHWGDNREDFLSRLDPKKTAQVLSDAGVQMLQLCAKSHWGLSIYPTKVGKQHPNLRGRDYFGEVLAALNAKGIKCMAYFSDYWDMHAGRTHPEWRFLTSAQSRGEEPVREGWWWTLCPETGYNDYLIAQMVEVAERYPLAGIFIDMVGFMGYCYCPSCRPKFQRDTGHEIPEKEDWSSPLWRRFIEWRYRETARILKQRRQAVLAANGDLVFSHNYHGNCYHYYGLSHEPVEAHAYADYFTTESSPWDFAFGLQGGSQAAKFARGAAPDKPIEVVGGRGASGHDFTRKPFSELLLDTYSVIAHDCPYAIIESAGWDGRPIAQGFELIGRVFDRVKRVEPWVRGSEPVPYVGLLFSRRSADMYNTEDKSRVLREKNGFYKVCIEEHLPVGYLFDQTLTPENLAQCAVIALPDAAVLDERQCQALEDYVRRGGGLVATHQASLRTPKGALRENFPLADVFGCDLAQEPSNAITWMSGTTRAPLPDIASALGGSFVLFRETPSYLPVKARKDALVLAERWRAPFDAPSGPNHSSHYEPPYKKTGEPLVIANRHGKGRCVYIATRPGSAYMNGGYREVGQLLRSSLRWAANKPLPLLTDAPKSVEALLSRQRNRLVLHLFNFSCGATLPSTVMDFPGAGLGPMRKSWVSYDEPVVLREIRLKVRAATAPAKVYLVPSRAGIPHTFRKGHVEFTLPELKETATVAIEFPK